MPPTLLFFSIDITFFLANLLKIASGGWFPLLIGAGMFLLMHTWWKGRVLMRECVREQSIQLTDLLDYIFVSPPMQVPCTAVYLSPQDGVTPSALMHNLRHCKVLHEHNLFVAVQHHEVPWISFDRRCTVTPLGHDCWHLTLHFGFKDDPDVPAALKLLESHGVPLDEMEASYFLSRDIVIQTPRRSMALWRERLFASIHRNASDIAGYLNLPSNRVVELGAKVEI